MLKKIFSSAFLFSGVFFLVACSQDDVDFNDAMVEEATVVREEMAGFYAKSNTYDTLEEVNEKRMEVSEQITSSLNTVNNLEVVDGGDEFHQTVIDYLEISQDTIDNKYPTLLEAFYGDDLDAANAALTLEVDYDNAIDDAWDNMMTAQKNFADEKDMQLVQ